MDCRAFQAIEDDLLDGALDTEREAAARAHLEVCARCRREFEELGVALQALRAVPEAALPQGMWESFRNYAARREEEESLGIMDRLLRAWRRRVSAVCFGMILFVTVVSTETTRRLQKYVVPAA